MEAEERQGKGDELENKRQKQRRRQMEARAKGSKRCWQKAEDRANGAEARDNSAQHAFLNAVPRNRRTSSSFGCHNAGLTTPQVWRVVQKPLGTQRSSLIVMRARTTPL